MEIKWNPFQRPRPIANCLTNEAVLVQAWKKTHAYIRTRNWYADVLELDLSAANLKSDIEQWQSDYIENGYSALKPSLMRLVPAPKSWPWEFGEGSEGGIEWRPVIKKNEDTRGRELLVLRPLAHLTIRDQTFATAAMI